MRTSLPLLFLAVLWTACGSGPKECTLSDANSCPTDQICERMQGGDKPMCFQPVLLSGRVFDLTALGGIADAYDVAVFDGLGNKIWAETGLRPTNGSSNLSLAYAGPMLSAGGFYQWRVTAMRQGRPTSLSEDLKGLFTVQ